MPFVGKILIIIIFFNRTKLTAVYSISRHSILGKQYMWVQGKPYLLNLGTIRNVKKFCPQNATLKTNILYSDNLMKLHKNISGGTRTEGRAMLPCKIVFAKSMLAETCPLCMGGVTG